MPMFQWCLQMSNVQIGNWKVPNLKFYFVHSNRKFTAIIIIA